MEANGLGTVCFGPLVGEGPCSTLKGLRWLAIWPAPEVAGELPSGKPGKVHLQLGAATGVAGLLEPEGLLAARAAATALAPEEPPVEVELVGVMDPQLSGHVSPMGGFAHPLSPGIQTSFAARHGQPGPEATVPWSSHAIPAIPFSPSL